MIFSSTIEFLWSTVMLFWLCRLSNTTGRPTLSTIYEINLNETTGFELNLEKYNVSDAGIEEFNSARLEKIRERQKQKRIETIRNQIMGRVGLPNKRNVTFIVSEDARDILAKKLEELQSEQENNTPNSANEIYAERVQSFYPSCSLPRNTDREVWDDPSNFHIYYNISSPRQLQGTSINVSAAKLRLYKNFENTSSKSTLLTDEPGLLKDEPWHDETNNRSENDEYLRVTVYQYLKPLRRHRRPKKKPLDSKRVSPNYEGWIEFNIQSSIRDWFENGNKNFGLEIILQDANEVAQNPSSFFQNMNCSESRANDPPFPRNLFEDDPTVGDNESALFDNETYPTLDLRTVEFQEEVTPISNVTDLRRKRKASYGNAFDTKSCHLEEVRYFSFKELGWDWVIEPPGFTWFECIDSCDDAKNKNIETSNKDRFCLPSSFSSLIVTVVGENNTLNNITIQNIIASSCFCASDQHLPISNSYNSFKEILYASNSTIMNTFKNHIMP